MAPVTEVTREAVRVLEKVGEKSGFRFDFEYALIGGAAIDATGDPLPDETVDVCRRSGAVLLGAVGGPKWDNPSAQTRPEQGLLRIRKELGLFANIRPIKLSPALASVSVLKEDVIKGVDMVVVRELTGGLYFGRPSKVWETEGLWEAVDTLSYTEEEISRIVRKACEIASGRRNKVTSVDKQNVLSTSRLWRRIAGQVAAEYPSITLENMLVDSCAMHLITRPSSFDVIVTENTFGDILTDEASQVAGSMGMLPSASLSEGKLGMYEPSHGSAPKYAGKNIINPLATILSAGMMLRYSLDLPEAADAVDRAVESTVADGIRTKDIWEEGMTLVGTSEMGDAVAKRILK
jgi:3-isopropylmalate dehydrogenase